MRPATEEVLRTAQGLPGAEQWALIGELLAGLEGSEMPISLEWLAEIQRRSMAHDRGETASSPWAEARARLQARMDDRG